MGIRYAPALDGLRAIAVLLVVAAHTDAPGLAGGRRGVDIFFVLSGFLITSIIRGDIAAGRFDVLRFWGRRLRRLAPALLAMLTAYVVLAPWLAPDHATSRWIDAAKSALYLTDYAYEPLGPLLHTWSLAIEEQFYLIWPFAMLLVVRTRSPGLVLIGLWAALTALRIAWFALAEAPIVSAYYSLHCHASGLALGAALAYAPKLPRGIGFAGAALLAGQVLFGSAGMAPSILWGISLAEIGTALLILDLVRPGPLQQALSFEPLRRLGLISYAVYLWHLPIHAALEGQSHLVQGLGTLVLSIAIATVSFFTIERWTRRRSERPLIPRTATTAG